MGVAAWFLAHLRNGRRAAVAFVAAAVVAAALWRLIVVDRAAAARSPYAAMAWWPPHLEPSDVKECATASHATTTGATLPAKPKPRVVVFSLYGADPRYTDSAIRNAELMVDLLPDWQMWVMVPDPASNPALEVPKAVLDRIRACGGRIITVSQALMDRVGFGMNQRFLVAEDASIERFAVRDIDSRMLLRDRWALQHWIASGETFHNFRDHPAHSAHSINGGMWGARGGAVPNVTAELAEYVGDKSGFMADMRFLNEKVWPLMQARGVLQLDSTSCKRWAGAKPFPYPRAGGEHIGAVMDSHELIRKQDLDPIIQTPEGCPSPRLPAESRIRIGVLALARCASLLDIATSGAATPDGSGCHGANTPIAECAQLASHNITILGVVGVAMLAETGRCGKQSSTITPDLGGTRDDDAVCLLFPRCGPVDHRHLASAGNFPTDPELWLPFSKDEIHCSSAFAHPQPPEAMTPLVVLVEWRDVFVDHVMSAQDAGCVADSVPPPPRVFSYALQLEYEEQGSSRCTSRSYTLPPQLHERIPANQTHYDALGGLLYHRNLAIVQAAYLSEAALFVGLALPYIKWLARPQQSLERLVVLLPNTPTVAATVGALLDTGALSSFGNTTANATHTGKPWWERHPRLRVHKGAPTLYWAYRLHLVALTSSATHGTTTANMAACATEQFSCARKNPLLHAAVANAVVGVALATRPANANSLDRQARRMPPCVAATGNCIDAKPIAVVDVSDRGLTELVGLKAAISARLNVLGFKVIELSAGGLASGDNREVSDLVTAYASAELVVIQEGYVPLALAMLRPGVRVLALPPDDDQPNLSEMAMFLRDAFATLGHHFLRIIDVDSIM